MTDHYDDQVPANLTVHVGDESRLFARADRTPRPTEVLLVPVQLHQRNIHRRLRETNRPKRAFEIVDPATAAESVLQAVDSATDAVDRIDRLSLLRSIVAGDDESIPPLATNAGSGGANDPKVVEQIRTEVESVTNFHPERVNAFRDAADELYPPIDADATAVAALAVSVERALREATSKAVSDVELVRRATRQIAATGGAAWTAAYPDIERVSLVGVSSLAAPQIDLLGALVEATSIEVEIHLRRGTGPYLAGRVPDLLDVTDPGTEVFE